MEKKAKGNILLKFTRKSLRENRTRTIVTIIGIMLSMALITAVIEGAYSGLQFLARSEIAASGKWEGLFRNLDEDQYEALKNDKEIKDSADFQTVGWAEIGTANEYKPYLLIWSAGDKAEEFVHINIKEGRMPENENEIMLPIYLSTDGGVRYQVGDRLELDVGKRVLDGEDVNSAEWLMPGETLTDTVKKTYTVVGLYERLDYDIEQYSCPGYTAITKGAAGMSHTVVFTVSNTNGFYKYMSRQTISGSWEAHTDLLYYKMVSKNNNLMRMLFTLTLILVLLIAFGSVTLIYNSFSISVSERTRQFGILKSIGATGRQVRASVLYEAILLAIIGIVIGCAVGCAGIGITLYCLRDKFSGLIGTAAGTNVEMKLIINPVALIIAAVICLITVMISAWIPANRAMRISPIDAIRQSMDIKVNPKKVKTSRFTQKLFGIEGTLASKNFKRNKKRCRSVIISIFLSVLLFIAASSFCTYLKDSVDGATSSRNNYEIAVQLSAGEGTSIDYDAFLREFKGSKYVEGGAYGMFSAISVSAGEAQMMPGHEMFFNNYNGIYDVFCYLTFIDDDTFRDICRENDIDPAPYFNAADPMALVYNTSYYYYEVNGSYKYSNIEVFNLENSPITIGYSEPQQVDGYSYQYREIADDGSVHAYYLPANEIDVDKVVEMPEGIQIKQLKLGDEVTKTGDYINRSNIALIYPASALSQVVGENSVTNLDLQWVNIMLRAHDHVNAAADIEQMLSTKESVGYSVYDVAQENESVRAIILIIDVFSYGFIIIISLIAVANIFNTISTNLNLRRREIAMLKSIGLSNKGFTKMMNLESIIYGLRGLMWGLPISIIVTYLIFTATNNLYDSSFYIPWHSLVIAVGSVFVIIFAAMWYTAAKIRKDNVVETLKNENL